MPKVMGSISGGAGLYTLWEAKAQAFNQWDLNPSSATSHLSDFAQGK